MPTVETTSGPIEGREKDGSLLFAGVPYAAPPIADMRFKAAIPHEPWQEVRAAKRFGPAAPQRATGGLTDAVSVRWDEDCLTLNICTPAADSSSRPVLVWIHGGAYRTGQGAIPWYAGGRFASQGNIVVVSINYRLGALGFTDLSHLGSDYATSGANGLLDQIEALKWVQGNIERFGGDPAKVTIAGESAGGFATTTLLASPVARDLFRAVIPQSGAAHHTLPKAAGELCAEKFMDSLKAHTSDALAAVSVDAVLEAQDQVSTDIGQDAGSIDVFGVSVAPFYPVEGNRVVPENPLTAIATGASNDIPVLTGSNRDETTLWGYGAVDEAKLQRMAAAYGAEPVLDIYRQTRPGASAEELMIAMTTDHMFRIPALRLLEARLQAGQPSHNWLYQFCWKSRAFEGRMGATHSLEIPFAFDNLDKGGVDVFIGPGDKPQHVADVMHRCWTNFITDLDPGWGAYGLDERRTMIFDDESESVQDPDAAERLAWDGIR